MHYLSVTKEDLVSCALTVPVRILSGVFALYPAQCYKSLNL